jgi:hypothetical protein
MTTAALPQQDSTRPHGYARYRLDGCRCYVCGFSASQYELNRQRQIAAGTWQPYVDAAPARAHLAALAAAGVGRRRVMSLTGLTDSALIKLARGVNGRPPSRRIRPETERLILSIPLGDESVADGQAVDATGTIRRVQAMVALGWTFTVQAALAGRALGNYNAVMRAVQVRRSTADGVKAVYAQLSMTVPEDTPSSRRARAHAAARNWFAPLAWDDDNIDDPAATPVLLPPVDGSDPAADEMTIQHRAAGHDVPVDTVTRIEIVRRLTAANAALVAAGEPGHPTAYIAAMVCASTQTVYKIQGQLAQTAAVA